MYLDAMQLAAYERDGFLCPIPVLSSAELERCESKLADLAGRIVGDPEQNKRMQYKAHLLYPWLSELVRHPAILDAVESLIGPDILVWNSGFLIKKPRDSSFVSWHQDATYWGLEPMEVASAWVALRPSTIDNGCVQCIPGTHRLAQLPHDDTFGQNNMLSRGQTIAVEIDATQAVPLQLQAGEMSLHHVRVVHGSQPNRSDAYRIGFIINYVSTRVRQTAGGDSATLVRGRDRFGHFEVEHAPSADLAPAAVAAHQQAMERQLSHIMK